VKRSEWITSSNGGIGGVGTRAGFVVETTHDRVEMWIDLVDALKMSFDDLTAGGLTAGDEMCQLASTTTPQFHVPPLGRTRLEVTLGS